MRRLRASVGVALSAPRPAAAPDATSRVCRLPRTVTRARPRATSKKPRSTRKPPVETGKPLMEAPEILPGSLVRARNQLWNAPRRADLRSGAAVPTSAVWRDPSAPPVSLHRPHLYAGSSQVLLDLRERVLAVVEDRRTENGVRSGLDRLDEILEPAGSP